MTDEVEVSGDAFHTSHVDHEHLNPRSVWLFFGHSLMRLSIIPVALTLLLISFVPENGNLTESLYQILLISIVANVAFWLIVSFMWSWFIYHSYRYHIGEKAFQKEFGVLSKRYVAIPFENIQNIEINRSLSARILGLSELEIETASIHTAWDGQLPGILKSEAVTLKDILIKKSHEAKAALR